MCLFRRALHRRFGERAGGGSAVDLLAFVPVAAF
jgi:hypothetical protein